MNIDEKRLKTKELLLTTDKMIHIERKELQEILFEKDSSGKRYLVFSGPFLRNLDLSEISFVDAVWNIDGDFSENIYKERNITSIDLSNTNAKIEFGYHGTSVILCNCNFANVDLSESGYNIIRKASNCNFSNCNIEYFNNYFTREFLNCDFSNNDFSNTFINSLSIPFGCNFAHTGIRVEHRLIDYLQEYRNTKYKEIVDYLFDNTLSSEDRSLVMLAFKPFNDNNKKLGKMIKNGLLDGCFVNNKRIYSAEEQEEIKSTLREYYKRKGKI